MSRTFSLQRRLSIGLAVGLTATWLTATLAAGLIVRHELDEAFDSALQETAQRLLPLAAVQILDRDSTVPARRLAAVGDHVEFLTYIVRDGSGTILLQSHDAHPSIFPERPARGFRDTATHRIYGESAISETLFVEVAEPLQHRRRAAIEAALGLFAPLPLVIPLSIFGVLWFVRRSMQPVLTFKEDIERRGEGDLSPVDADRLPSEIGPLADAVNRLMARLRRALEAERSFATNSAHELRTPIAAMLAQTQRLIAEAPEGPLRGRARQIETSLRRLARLSEKLMQLARAEGGGLLAEIPQDLGLVLEHVMDEFRRSPDAGSRLKLVKSASGPLWSRMDPDAFAILMRNLIQNALKHGRPDGEVEVVLAGSGMIRVLNDGPPVAPEMLGKLKGRFERGRTDALGSGLGLAIADAIAAGAGGKLELISPATGRPGGFEAALRLPESSSSRPKQKGTQ